MRGITTQMEYFTFLIWSADVNTFTELPAFSSAFVSISMQKYYCTLFLFENYQLLCLMHSLHCFDLKSSSTVIHLLYHKKLISHNYIFFTALIYKPKFHFTAFFFNLAKRFPIPAVQVLRPLYF